MSLPLTVVIAVVSSLVLLPVAVEGVAAWARMVCFVLGVAGVGVAFQLLPERGALLLLWVDVVVLVVVLVADQLGLLRVLWSVLADAVEASWVTRAGLQWLRGALAARPDLADMVLGMALEAVANGCESCHREPATMRRVFADGTAFRVCEPCAMADEFVTVRRPA